MAVNDQFDNNFTFQEPRPQRFSLPLPIIKHLIDNSTPTVWKKLIKTCKYFYCKKSVYPIYRIKAVNGFKWNADGEIFDPTKFIPKIWLYDSVVIHTYPKSVYPRHSYFDICFISTLISMITVNDIRNIDIFYRHFSWKKYKFLTSSAKLERIHLLDCSVKYSDKSIVTFDKLLENLSSLKYFKIISPVNSHMFKPDTIKKMAPILANFKTEPFISFQDLPQTCNFPEFIDLVMKNETVNVGVSFSSFAYTFCGGNEKCKHLINTILANPPKRIPCLELPPNNLPEYREYQKLYKARND